MTEKEAVDELKMDNERCRMQCENSCSGIDNNQCNCEDGIIEKMIDELLAYREIGTINDCRQSMQIINVAEREWLSKIIDEWILYHKIGTVEEVRNAVEKQKAKKVLNRKIVMTFHNTPYAIKGDCPVCNCKELMAENADYCSCCGQRMDWSGENE